MKTLLLSLILSVGLAFTAFGQNFSFLELEGQTSTEGIKTVPSDLSTIPDQKDLSNGYYTNRHDVLNLSRLDAVGRFDAVIKYLGTNGVNLTDWYLFTPIQSQFFYPEYRLEDRKIIYGPTMVVFNVSLNPNIRTNGIDATMLFDYPEVALTELTGKYVKYTGADYIQSEVGDPVGVELKKYNEKTWDKPYAHYYSTSKAFDGSQSLNDIVTRKDGSVFRLRSIQLSYPESLYALIKFTTVWERLN